MIGNTVLTIAPYYPYFAEYTDIPANLLFWVGRERSIYTQGHIKVELYFTCPVTGLEYGTDQYNLQKGYRIQTNDTGEKYLAGNVDVQIPCPHCGMLHTHNVQHLACPLERTSK